MARLNHNASNSPSPSLAQQSSRAPTTTARAPTPRATTTLHTIEQEWGSNFYTAISTWPERPGETLVRALRNVSKHVPLNVFAPQINQIIDTRHILPGRKGGRKTGNITITDVKAYISQFPLPSRRRSLHKGGSSSGEEQDEEDEEGHDSEPEPDEDKEIESDPLIHIARSTRATSERYSLRNSQLSTSPAPRNPPLEDGKGASAKGGDEQEQSRQNNRTKLPNEISRGSITASVDDGKEQQNSGKEEADPHHTKRSFVQFSQDVDSVVGIQESGVDRIRARNFSKIARTDPDLSSPFIYKSRTKRLKVYSTKPLSTDHKLPPDAPKAFRETVLEPKDSAVVLTEDQNDNAVDVEQQQREETDSLEVEQSVVDEGMDTIVVKQEDILDTPIEAERVLTSPLRDHEGHESSQEMSPARIDIPDSPTRPQELDHIQNIWKTPCDLACEFDLRHGVRLRAFLMEESISRLCDEEWYNDEIMIFYTRLLQEQYREYSEKVWVCHSYFSTHIANWNYEAGKISKDWPGNFFNYHYVLFPTHLKESDHWLLVIADTGTSSTPGSQPRLWILDSLATSPSIHSQIFSFYQNFIFDQLSPASPFKDPTSLNSQAIIQTPPQRNGYDCGPYSLQHVDKFLQDPKNFISNLEASIPSWSGYQVNYRRVICGKVLATRLASLRQSLDHQQKIFESSSSSDSVPLQPRLSPSSVTTTQDTGAKLMEAIAEASTSVATKKPRMSRLPDDEQAEAEPEALLDAAIEAYQRTIKKVQEEVKAIMEQQADAQNSIQVARQAALDAVQANPRRKQARKSKEANTAIAEAQERYHDACKREATTRERLRVLTCKLGQLMASVDDSEDE